MTMERSRSQLGHSSLDSGHHTMSTGTTSSSPLVSPTSLVSTPNHLHHRFKQPVVMNSLSRATARDDDGYHGGSGSADVATSLDCSYLVRRQTTTTVESFTSATAANDMPGNRGEAWRQKQKRIHNNLPYKPKLFKGGAVELNNNNNSCGSHTSVVDRQRIPLSSGDTHHSSGGRQRGGCKQQQQPQPSYVASKTMSSVHSGENKENHGPRHQQLGGGSEVLHNLQSEINSTVQSILTDDASEQLRKPTAAAASASERPPLRSRSCSRPVTATHYDNRQVEGVHGDVIISETPRMVSSRSKSLARDETTMRSVLSRHDGKDESYENQRQHGERTSRRNDNSAVSSSSLLRRIDPPSVPVVSFALLFLTLKYSEKVVKVLSLKPAAVSEIVIKKSIRSCLAKGEKRERERVFVTTL